MAAMRVLLALLLCLASYSVATASPQVTGLAGVFIVYCRTARTNGPPIYGRPAPPPTAGVTHQSINFLIKADQNLRQWRTIFRAQRRFC